MSTVIFPDITFLVARLMVETSENQKKMNKVLQDLLKSSFTKAETGAVSVPEEKERDRDRERERDRDRDERDDRKRKRRDRDRSREREESSGSRGDKRSKSPETGLDSLSAGTHQVSSGSLITYLSSHHHQPFSD